jgi:hypothetical protein
MRFVGVTAMNSDVHFTGGCVGVRVSLGGSGKIYSPLGSEPLTIKHVASCYSDCAGLAPRVRKCRRKMLDC